MSDSFLQYSFYYTRAERSPELARIRRFLAEYHWMLNDNVYEIQKQIKACNMELSRIRGDTYIVTDYHRAQSDGSEIALDQFVGRLKKLLRQHAQDSITYHQLADLPDQVNVFARNFSEADLFKNGLYGPTGEDEAEYKKVPAGPEFFSGREPEPIDYVTRFFIWMKYSVNAWRDKKKSVVRVEQEFIDSGFSNRVVNFAAALYISLLLSGTLGILSILDSEKMRIIVLGLMGVLLQVSLILLIPGLKRDGMIAILAAYFAVGGIFIGAKSNGVS